ncbi:hypothetical protein [Jiella sonneratiae]|uniref:Uncharacterized protein n=1 Tax=Jiella sonneratiae TaxID=2816856 RepID=A0ABS3J7K6_9HYPH|nr:hypothetical protein [Jiella sonneratiae]MBO0905661.1 hypothetical protein [Jiella sonneratiae]
MSRRTIRGLIAVAVLAVIAVGARPAGAPQPLIVRVVTMGDHTGPAFYSLIEQGYRFIDGNAAADTDRFMTGAVREASAATAAAALVTADARGRPAR